jgi:glycerol-3-phosphate acyltransferase PlsY
MDLYLSIGIAYLVGSIPFGYIITKLLRGEDIRKTGSGNIGATNVMRLLGKKVGYITFLLDSLKAILAIMICENFSEYNAISSDYLIGLIAIFAHCYPIWLKFQGGKGVATAIGLTIYIYIMFIPQLFWVLLILTSIWLVIYKLTKIVSLASIILFVAMPIANYFSFKTFEIHGFTAFSISVMLSLLIIWRHKGNIIRLIQGRENNFRKKAQ